MSWKLHVLRQIPIVVLGAYALAMLAAIPETASGEERFIAFGWLAFGASAILLGVVFAGAGTVIWGQRHVWQCWLGCVLALGGVSYFRRVLLFGPVWVRL